MSLRYFIKKRENRLSHFKNLGKKHPSRKNASLEELASKTGKLILEMYETNKCHINNHLWKKGKIPMLSIIHFFVAHRSDLSTINEKFPLSTLCLSNHAMPDTMTLFCPALLCKNNFHWYRFSLYCKTFVGYHNILSNVSRMLPKKLPLHSKTLEGYKAFFRTRK